MVERFEINLICPKCGSYMFDIEENNKFSCSDCSWIGSMEEMTPAIFSAD